MFPFVNRLQSMRMQPLSYSRKRAQGRCIAPVNRKPARSLYRLLRVTVPLQSQRSSPCASDLPSNDRC
jgi:hypothetical protein